MEMIQLIKDGPTRASISSLRSSIPSIIAQEIQRLIDSGAFSFEFVRSSTNPAFVPVPTQFSIYVWDRQASGLGDIEYHSLQKSTGQWVWFQVIKAT